VRGWCARDDGAYENILIFRKSQRELVTLAARKTSHKQCGEIAKSYPLATTIEFTDLD
jgi:hypothetical protein